MDLTLLVVAVLVAAALTWWFMTPPRHDAPTGHRSPDPTPTRVPPDERTRRLVGLLAGVLLVLVVVLAFVLARFP